MFKRRSVFSSYYPDNADRERERKYKLWLEAPGDDLAIFLGGSPSAEQFRVAEAQQRRRRRSQRGQR